MTPNTALTDLGLEIGNPSWQIVFVASLLWGFLYIAVIDEAAATANKYWQRI